MDEILAIAGRHGLAVIEDAAHAHGACYKGRKIGTIGDLACFSFQATKSLPCGEGGILVTNNQEYFERALLLAQSPSRLNLHLQMEQHRRFKDTGFGAYKYRINPINAVIALGQMPYFEERNAIRQKNIDHLTQRLETVPGIRVPYTAPHVTRGGHYGYPLLYCPDELDDLPVETYLRALQAEGVPLSRERYPMLHLSPMYQEHNPPGRGWPWSYSAETRAVVYRRGDLPITEEIYPRLLAIPVWDKGVPCEELFDQYAEAFRKVASNTGQLKSVV
jgi:dTDP-4-amino-4,6-dideoxygalactose transaminase